MRIPTPDFLLSAFIQVCRRFPGTMLCATLSTIACFVLINGGVPGDQEEFFVRSLFTSQLGLPFLTAIAAYSESRIWSKYRGLLLQGIGLIALIGCWFWMDTKADNFERQILPQYAALILVMHLAVAVSPHLNARPVRVFWEYNRHLFANLVVGCAFTLIMFAGLGLAILAVDNLFDLNIREKVYGKLFVLLAGIFNTAYFLFHFPKAYDSAQAGAAVSPKDSATGPLPKDPPPQPPQKDTSPQHPPKGEAYNWVFRNLCIYILIPIVILYFVILYAYGAKIGLQWSLPKGWISSLVIGFSVAGVFTYLLNFYLSEEDDSPLVKGFKRWFWWGLLPPTGLLFIAIGKRISDYGVTEERFLVAQLGVWLAAACLYFLISKNDNIKFIPISLALFALVWAFGPLSAFNVSERSQKGILTRILERNGRFENGKMKPGSSLLTDPECEQVNSAISYLERRDALTDLLPSPIDSAWLEYGGLQKWLNIESASGDYPEGDKIHTLTINQFDSAEPLDVRGFDKAYKAMLNSGNDRTKDDPGTFFCLSESGNMLEWRASKDGETLLVEGFSLAPSMQKWLEKQVEGENYTYLTLPVSERTINFYGSKGSLRLIVEEVQIEVDGEEKRLNYCNGWVLLKEK